jgi:hypothetical protein
MVPVDLRAIFLEQVAVELRGCARDYGAFSERASATPFMNSTDASANDRILLSPDVENAIAKA